MKEKIKKIVGIIGIIGIFTTFPMNSYALFGSSTGADTYWNMKNYYENLASKLEIIKDYQLQLEKFKMQIEQWKKLPDEVLRRKTNELVKQLNEMYKANQYTQGALKSSKKAEMAFDNLYKDLLNSGDIKSYQKAVDDYYLTMKNIGKDILVKNGQSQLAQKDFKTKMVTLANELQTAKNPIQTLNVIGRINQEMAVTLERVTTLMEQTTNANRLKEAKELAEQQAIEERNRATRESIKKSIKHHEQQAKKYQNSNKKR